MPKKVRPRGYVPVAIVLTQSDVPVAIASKFATEELRGLAKGITPKGYIWHHHQNPGLMQLVDSEMHKVWHIGGFSIWGPGN